jgi:hypothetical protein
MHFRRHTTSRGAQFRALTITIVALTALSAPISAQSGHASGLGRGLEERAALEAEARTAEAEQRTAEASLLRMRLQRGDFQDGDRIVVRLLGGMTLSDTITVRGGKMLPLPKMDDLPLEGVLRSELTPRLSRHLARYLRDSTVQTTPLLRLAVLGGGVRAPNFYYTSADVLLSDVIVRAGGLANNADMGNIVIRRAGETIWNARDTRTALSEGFSLDRLHLRAGDEVYVGEQRSFDWYLAVQIGATLAGIVFALTRFHF